MNLTDGVFDEAAQRLEKELTARLESVRSFSTKFIQEVKAVFEGVPSIGMIKWEQYTPYFNDGDTCEFRVDEPTFIRDSKLEELEEDNDLYSWNAKDYLPALQTRLIENLAEFMEENEDSLRAYFGDHSQIKILRDGTISVDVYDHD